MEPESKKRTTRYGSENRAIALDQILILNRLKEYDFKGVLGRQSRPRTPKRSSISLTLDGRGLI
jgi:hypothetical protein